MSKQNPATERDIEVMKEIHRVTKQFSVTTVDFSASCDGCLWAVTPNDIIKAVKSLYMRGFVRYSDRRWLGLTLKGLQAIGQEASK